MDTIKVTVENDDGEETTHELPARFEVCPTCEGHGTHLTPSIRDHAYSRDEFMEAFDDEEDRAQYFRRGGIYDVQCEECKGRRVVPVVAEDLVTTEQRPILDLWARQEQSRLDYERETTAERQMEARMMGEW